MDDSYRDIPAVSRWTSRLAVATAIVVSAAYTAAVLAGPTSWWPESVRAVSITSTQWIHAAVRGGLGMLGAASPSAELRGGAYLIVVSAVVPWLLMALAGRGRPVDLGFRRPNRIGWRIVVIGFVLALPLLLWMVRSPRFAVYYLPHLDRAGTWVFIVYYVVNMSGEHFFFHGVLLAVCRRGHRWPVPAPIATNAVSSPGRVLQWLGLAQPLDGARGIERVTRWIGLPGGCVPAVCTSGLLFAFIHVGKDPRELALSLPGGIVLAYVAYWTNSWLIPFILHLATAGMACAMMVAMR